MTPKELQDALIKGLEDLRAIIKDIKLQQDLSEINMSNFKLRLDNIDKNIDELYIILRGDGNDTRAVTVKLAVLENSLSNFEKNSSKDNPTKENWQIMAALITGCFGLITALVTAAFQFIK